MERPVCDEDNFSSEKVNDGYESDEDIFKTQSDCKDEEKEEFSISENIGSLISEVDYILNDQLNIPNEPIFCKGTPEKKAISFSQQTKFGNLFEAASKYESRNNTNSETEQDNLSFCSREPLMDAEKNYNTSCQSEGYSFQGQFPQDKPPSEKEMLLSLSQEPRSTTFTSVVSNNLESNMFLSQPVNRSKPDEISGDNVNKDKTDTRKVNLFNLASSKKTVKRIPIFGMNNSQKKKLVNEESVTENISQDLNKKDSDIGTTDDHLTPYSSQKSLKKPSFKPVFKNPKKFAETIKSSQKSADNANLRDITNEPKTAVQKSSRETTDPKNGNNTRPDDVNADLEHDQNKENNIYPHVVERNLRFSPTSVKQKKNNSTTCALMSSTIFGEKMVKPVSVAFKTPPPVCSAEFGRETQNSTHSGAFGSADVNEEDTCSQPISSQEISSSSQERKKENKKSSNRDAVVHAGNGINSSSETAKVHSKNKKNNKPRKIENKDPNRSGKRIMKPRTNLFSNGKRCRERISGNSETFERSAANNDDNEAQCNELSAEKTSNESEHNILKSSEDYGHEYDLSEDSKACSSSLAFGKTGNEESLGSSSSCDDSSEESASSLCSFTRNRSNDNKKRANTYKDNNTSKSTRCSDSAASSVSKKLKPSTTFPSKKKKFGVVSKSNQGTKKTESKRNADLIKKRLYELQDQTNFPVWVQCNDCNKWRCLQNELDPAVVPSTWTCSLNDDRNRSSCTASEEEYDSSDPEETFVYNNFTLGSVVWVKNYWDEWWPGIVDDDPDTETFFWLPECGESFIPNYYHVTFFGSNVSRAWIKSNCISAFTETGVPIRGRVRSRTKEMEVLRAINEARKAVQVPIVERRRLHCFAARFKGSWWL